MERPLNPEDDVQVRTVFHQLELQVHMNSLTIQYRALYYGDTIHLISVPQKIRWMPDFENH